MLEQDPHYPQEPASDEFELHRTDPTDQGNAFMATAAETGFYPSDPDAPIAAPITPRTSRPLGRHVPIQETGERISKQIAAEEAADQPSKTDEQRVDTLRDYKKTKAALRAARLVREHDELMASVADIEDPVRRQHQLDARLKTRADREAARELELNKKVARWRGEQDAS